MTGEEADLQARLLGIQSAAPSPVSPEHRSPRPTSAAYRSAPYYLTRSFGSRHSRGHSRDARSRGASSSANGDATNSEPELQQPQEPPNDNYKANTQSIRLQQALKTVANVQGADPTLASEEHHVKADNNPPPNLAEPPGDSKNTPTSRTPNVATHQIVLDGICFQVTNRGRRLLRMPNQDDSKDVLPKSVEVAGVTFDRTKNGNYFRRALVNIQKYLRTKAEEESHLISTRSRNASGKSTRLCAKFTATGFCNDGPKCRFIHDPAKVAICKDLLIKGSCSTRDTCDLSHDLTPHRVPACLYFQRGNCNNTHCRYVHVKYKPGALTCASFARIGYCDNGAECTRRHVYECPEYANTGVCNKKDCRLPHVDRAAQLRKISGTATPKNFTDTDMSDFSSDNRALDPDGEDIDSDFIDEELLLPPEFDTSKDFEQQLDFVQL